MSSRVSGTIRASPSKSVTHRAIVLAGLSTGTCRIRRPLKAEDTDATIAGMEAFGTEFESSREGLRVIPTPLLSASKPLDVRHSGTTLRLLAGVASLIDGVSMLTGEASIQRRPMGPPLEAPPSLGASAELRRQDGPPPVQAR